jgi:hypothetical protein
MTHYLLWSIQHYARVVSLPSIPPLRIAVTGRQNYRQAVMKVFATNRGDLGGTQKPLDVRRVLRRM